MLSVLIPQVAIIADVILATRAMDILVVCQARKLHRITDPHMCRKQLLIIDRLLFKTQLPTIVITTNKQLPNIGRIMNPQLNIPTLHHKSETTVTDVSKILFALKDTAIARKDSMETLIMNVHQSVAQIKSIEIENALIQTLLKLTIVSRFEH